MPSGRWRRRAAVGIPGLNMRLALDADLIASQQALASGASMTQWRDQVAKGATALQASGANQPTYQVVGGVPYVQMPANGGFNISFDGPVTPDEFTVVMVLRNPTVSALQQVILHLGPQDASADAQTRFVVEQWFSQFALQQSGVDYVGQAMPTSWAVVAVAGSVSGAGLPEGRGAWVYLNGQRAFRTQTSNGAAFTAWASSPTAYLGGLGNGLSFPFQGAFRKVFCWDRRLTESELRATFAVLAAQTGVTLVGTTTKNVVAGIDSQSTGYTGSTSGYFDQYLGKQANTVRSYNLGVVGRTLVTALTLSTLYDGPYDATVAKNIFHAWGGTNDAGLGGADPTTVYNNYVAFCQARRTKGYKVVAVTALPRGAVAQYETDRQAFNTSIRTNWATFADALADVGADATIGVAGAQNNLTNYQADAIHPTTVGYGFAEALITTASNTL